jgi:UrcA family protein
MNVRNSKLGSIAATVAFIASAVLATGPASASINDSKTNSITLRYNPLDLNTEKGAERLLSRVSGAATRVCDAGGSTAQFIESGSYRSCRRDAIAQAVEDVNRAAVTAAYDRHFAERGERGLRAALGLRPVIEIQMVALGWTDVPEASAADPTP